MRHHRVPLPPTPLPLDENELRRCKTNAQLVSQGALIKHDVEQHFKGKL